LIFVLDASVTMCWLFNDGKATDRAYATGVLNTMKQEHTAALVPVTWGLEISNVLAKAESKGVITEVQSEAFLEMLAGIDIRADAATFPMALSTTLQLARRHRLSTYDASYLELALRESLTLATLDQALQKAAGKSGVKRFAAR
jgi:predicted nucleic acid-binding protein